MMNLTDLEGLSRDYLLVEQAIAYIETLQEEQPDLADIALEVGLSPDHFQRLFSRWVGISPKRFLQYLTQAYAKRLLTESKSILSVACETGLSGPGRLHDLFVSCEAVTPGEYKHRGQGLKISHGIAPSPFGPCMIAHTDRGICALTFVRERSVQDLTAALSCTWSKAVLEQNDHTAGQLALKIFATGQPDHPAPLHLFIKGTNFQIKVWEALTQIPLGRAVTYGDIARHIGHPGAVRAVGTAVGKNPIPYLIPCHRVIRKTGFFGNYGEGPLRKKAILGWEFARRRMLHP